MCRDSVTSINQFKFIYPVLDGIGCFVFMAIMLALLFADWSRLIFASLVLIPTTFAADIFNLLFICSLDTENEKAIYVVCQYLMGLICALDGTLLLLITLQYKWMIQHCLSVTSSVYFVGSVLHVLEGNYAQKLLIDTSWA
ncbi:uncharacterized protein LOC119662414 [Teleopsis dalmanni]|uniref:uncharacterized protein LOC119662414 n=1 Tax=Teleopsis dalmanni TaxID=139649 RepID=UPI000D32C0E0|nr:uncharacterized protein LOC119662414 [Teleopsis dalmanni]